MIEKRALSAVAFAGSLMAIVTGCVQPGDADENEASIQEMLASDPSAGGIPEGAIPISDTIYAVPVAVDADGCEQFSEWSTEGVARQLIQFHDGQGGFTAIKSAEHSCNAVMVEAGEDDRGCMMYRAEQPDGSATDVAYYPAGSGFSTNPNKSDCAG